MLFVRKSLSENGPLVLESPRILAKFDKYFHRNMLFMRAVRRVEGKRYEMPKFTDAIDLVSDFRRRNNWKPIYVGECDIQKFYGIFNYDVIVGCFEDLFAEAKDKDGAEDKDFDLLRRVINAYLDSFNYPEYVMSKNDDPEYWKNEVCHYRSDLYHIIRVLQSALGKYNNLNLCHLEEFLRMLTKHHCRNILNLETFR